MGGGSYSYHEARARSNSFSQQTREQIFSSHMSAEMNIKNKVRQCCETEEHPNTLPIIIALDVTGSMGHLPESLIKKDFPEIMKKILDCGIEHPEVCFLAIGDHECDRAPFQAGEFEASDKLMEKWLRLIFIESGGGGNGGESYSLAHYFAAFHTQCDAISKGRKGILITIGDEPNLETYPKDSLQAIFGESVEATMSATQIYEKAKQTWDIYHINVKDYSGRHPSTIRYWTNLLDPKSYIEVEAGSDTNVSNVISMLIAESQNVTSTNSTTSSVSSEQDSDEHLL